MKSASKNCFLILCFGLLNSTDSFGQNANAKSWMPEARLTIRVVDEAAASVQGATVRLGFQDQATGDMKLVSGLSDSHGIFAGQGGTVEVVGCDVRKAGYYLAGADIPHFTNSVAKRWQPWDATCTTILRKIEKPIPMYARIANVKVPAQSTPCGFDLKEADWVAPWGKGLVPDFVFTVKSAYTNYNQFDSSMKLTFSNPLDGIQPANLPKEFRHSEFIWHRLAPEAGYSTNYTQEKGLPKKHYQIPSAPNVHDLEDVEKQKFYFRVRTVEKDGQIVSALYGKLAAGFEMPIPNKTDIQIVLHYYLNPTPLDRNMEFDLKQNLFKNLKFDEQPRKP